MERIIHRTTNVRMGENMENKNTNERTTFATDHSKTICLKALKVFDELNKDEVKLERASELANTLGKANAAVGNLLKAEELELKLRKFKAK